MPEELELQKLVLVEAELLGDLGDLLTTPGEDSLESVVPGLQCLMPRGILDNPLLIGVEVVKGGVMGDPTL